MFMILLYSAVATKIFSRGKIRKKLKSGFPVEICKIFYHIEFFFNAVT